MGKGIVLVGRFGVIIGAVCLPDSLLGSQIEDVS